MKDPGASSLHMSDFNPHTAIQPFLQAARDASNISTTRAVVSKVLGHADIFCGYDQLRTVIEEESCVRASNHPIPDGESGGERSKILRTLQLFSYGTYQDYMNQMDSYMTLNDIQLFKLRQLTILSLTQDQGDPTLPYQEIQRALQLDDRRQMEQVLISCLYAGVISGKLCQKQQALLLQVPLGCTRDVPISDVPDLLQSVLAVQDRIGGAQQYLNEQQTIVAEHLQFNQAYWKQWATEREVVLDPATNWFGTVAAEVTSAAAAMDVTGRRQKRSRGGLTGMGVSAFQV